MEEPGRDTSDAGPGPSPADEPLARDTDRLVELLRPFDAAVLLAHARERDGDVLPGVPLS